MKNYRLRLFYVRSLSVLLLCLSSVATAQVKEYECHKGSEVWEYFNKFDDITDESYLITWDNEIIGFILNGDSFYYSINAVDKKILLLLEKNQKGIFDRLTDT